MNDGRFFIRTTFIFWYFVSFVRLLVCVCVCVSVCVCVCVCVYVCLFFCIVVRVSSPVRAQVRPLIHPLFHPLICPLVRLVVRPLVRPLVSRLVRQLVRPLLRPLVACSVACSSARQHICTFVLAIRSSADVRHPSSIRSSVDPSIRLTRIRHRLRRPHQRTVRIFSDTTIVRPFTRLSCRLHIRHAVYISDSFVHRVRPSVRRSGCPSVRRTVQSFARPRSPSVHAHDLSIRPAIRLESRSPAARNRPVGYASAEQTWAAPVQPVTRPHGHPPTRSSAHRPSAHPPNRPSVRGYNNKYNYIADRPSAHPSADPPSRSPVRRPAALPPTRQPARPPSRLPVIGCCRSH